jgi:DNA-binding response OmpR family regulator
MPIDPPRRPDLAPAPSPATHAGDDEPPIQAGAIRILPSQYEAFVDGSRVHLTLTQFRILAIMAKRPGWVFTPQQIARTLARTGVVVEPAAMRNHVYMMRRKLGQAGGSQLETVRGVGYRVTAQPHPADDDIASPSPAPTPAPAPDSDSA